MIGQSLPEYIFIRIAITSLRSIAPASILYLAASALSRRFLLSPWLAAVAIPEAAFYLFVYLPRRERLQQPAADADKAPLLSRPEREELFRRCSTHKTVSPYPLGWFLQPEIKRENVIEWLLWALFSSRREEAPEEWNEELDQYVDRLEEMLDTKFEEGRNDKVQSMRLPFDPVLMVHRPLFWYTLVFFVDLGTSMALTALGLKHYAPRKWFQEFPPRPINLFSRPAATPHLPYWHRPHTSTTKAPILFIHGIGIGLYPYVPFIWELITADPDVGLCLIELLPISMHMTDPLPARLVMLDAIQATLTSLDMNSVVLVGHSYGTIIAAHLLRAATHPQSPMPFHDASDSADDLDRKVEPLALAKKIDSVLLVDPIPLLLHLPDVTYNFLYRKPKEANEWLLWFFSSRDADVSRLLGRYLWWQECILWREDLLAESLPKLPSPESEHPNGKITQQEEEVPIAHTRPDKIAVFLSGKDQIVHSSAVWKYLTQKEETSERWVSEDEQLEVLYAPEMDHAAVFDSKVQRKVLLEVLERFVATS